MPSYEYRCPRCLTVDYVTLTIEEYGDGYHLVCTCSIPPTVMIRKFSFAATPTFEPHFNASTGTYVHSYRQLVDETKAASDKASARLGIEHNFVVHEAGDIASTIEPTE